MKQILLIIILKWLLKRHYCSTRYLVLILALLDILKQLPNYQSSDPIEQRQLKLLKLMGGVPLDPQDQRRLSTLQAKLTDIYSTSTVNGQQLEPDLTQLLQKSRDPQALLDAFIGWRNVTGPKMKGLYAEYVQLMNLGARDGGFENAADLSKLIISLCNAQKPQSMEEMERLFHSCKREPQVGRETINFLKIIWSETSTEQQKGKILSILDRLLDKLIMQKNDPLFMDVYKWLKYLEESIHPYERFRF